VNPEEVSVEQKIVAKEVTVSIGGRKRYRHVCFRDSGRLGRPEAADEEGQD
jgi:hypothetical protein